MFMLRSSLTSISQSARHSSTRSTSNFIFQKQFYNNRTFLRTMATYKVTSESKLGPLGEEVQHDHEEMYEYYQNYLECSGDADKQERWGNQLAWEVARHAVGEEIVVYPLMEQYLGAEGKRLADEDRAEHQIVKEQLYKLESLNAGTAEYNNTLKAVMEHLKPHNDSEELKDLPMLEAKISEEDAKAAAASFKRTKKFVPTRAHPSAPNQPPLETFVGFLAAPIDKLRDVFTKFPTEEMKHPSSNASH